MKTDMQTPSFRILLLKEGNAWSAQCLEHDIAAQGETIPDAVEQLALIIIGELSLRNGDLSEIEPPPDSIVDMYETKGTKIVRKRNWRNLIPSWGNRPAPSFGELRVA